MRALWVSSGALVVCGLGSGSAVAQQPAPATTITATGYGNAKPAPVDRRSERSIAVAVERAEKATLPIAVRAARERAAQIAQAAGLTLGRLVSISDAPGSPYVRTTVSATVDTVAAAPAG